MNKDRATKIAIELQKLYVSQATIVELLSNYPLELIERQLEYLPLRSPKRPAAMLVESIRYNYSAPKELYYAKTKANLPWAPDALDQDPESPSGQDDAQPEGHRTSSPPRSASRDGRLEQRGPVGDLVLPSADAAKRSSERSD